MFDFVLTPWNVQTLHAKARNIRLKAKAKNTRINKFAHRNWCALFLVSSFRFQKRSCGYQSTHKKAKHLIRVREKRRASASQGASAVMYVTRRPILIFFLFHLIKMESTHKTKFDVSLYYSHFFSSLLTFVRLIFIYSRFTRRHRRCRQRLQCVRSTRCV